jgi:hypothetical protein
MGIKFVCNSEGANQDAVLAQDSSSCSSSSASQCSRADLPIVCRRQGDGGAAELPVLRPHGVAGVGEQIAVPATASLGAPS